MSHYFTYIFFSNLTLVKYVGKLDKITFLLHHVRVENIFILLQ